MAETRFRVTIHDRHKGRVQHYDVERVLQALCLPRPDGSGEDWMVSVRGLNDVNIAHAIAVMLEQVASTIGSEPVAVGVSMFMADLIKPGPTAVIDYAAQDRDG